MAGKGKYDAFGRLVEAATESAKRQSGKTYKRTGTNSVSQKPQPVSPRPADPVPAPITKGTESSIPDADLKRIQRGEAHMDGGVVVDGPPPKEAELVEAAVNAARKESSGSVKSGAINPYKKSHGTTRSYTQATKALKPSSSKPSSAGTSATRSYSEGVNKAVESEKLQRNSQSSTKNQVNKNQQKFRKNKTSKKFEKISGDEKARAEIQAAGDKAQADTMNRKLESALNVIEDYVKNTQASGRITRESILANNTPEKIIEQADNLMKRFGGKPTTFTADKFKALVEESGAKAALEAVQDGLNNGRIAKDRGLQAAMAEVRGDIVVQNNLPKNKRRLTPEQQKLKDEVAAEAATKKTNEAKAEEIAAKKVAEQNALQAQREKPSLPVRGFNNAADFVKKHYDNGNVRRGLQTTGFGLTTVGGLKWLYDSLLADSEEERNAKEQAKLDMYR